MSEFNIVVTLFTLVYGILLTDLFSSFHRLVKNRKKVKWHWLSILSAWYIFLLILKNWWDFAFSNNSSQWLNIFYFIAYAHSLILLFLIASTALPDKVPEKGINLKTYYFQNHRYFWGLMSAIGFTFLLISVIPKILQNNPINISNLVANLIILALTILLSVNKKYWLHSVLLILFVILAILEILQH